MKFIRHIRSFYIVPMLIIGDVEEVTKHIWETSKSLIPGTERKFQIEDEEICKLDPGGLYHTKIPHKQFEIDNNKFDIQLSKIEDVLISLEYAKERVPGYMRFRLWRHFVILPVDIFNKLKNYLIDLEKSDEALHSELTEHLVYDDLIEKGFIIKFPRKKKE